MDFFGIGTPELLLILLIFFIFFGPTKLPEIASMMGKAMRKIKQASAEMNKNLQEMSDEIKTTSKEAQGDVTADKGLVQELKDVSKELGDAAKDVKDTALIPSALKKDLREVSKEISSAAKETAVAEPKQGGGTRAAGEKIQS